MEIKINNQKIGKKFKPYIIAELSANHGGSIEEAKKTILLAKESGASAVKIQSYTPSTMTIDCKKDDFQIKQGLWKGYNLFELYQKSYTPFEWHKDLFKYAKDIGISIFSTPFDETAVELLEKLNTPAYKIASFELVDLPLIKLIAKTNKPMLISTGMGSIKEIGDAVNVIKKNGNSKILLLHCISSYPALTEDTNLSNITFLKNKFDCLVGLSDHTMNNIASMVSISLGAVLIEKHFKPNNIIKSADDSFSLLPKEFKSLVDDCNVAWKALGNKKFSRSKNERPNLKFRRSLYFVKSLKKGTIITNDHIRRIRPGYGLPPKFFGSILGKKLKTDVEYGDPVKWEFFN